MLSCYRILDLTTEKAFMCGRALSDFGAEVIKIEKPGGDPARFRGLFPKDIVDPEKNLTWFAFNANKKSITLDITSAQGKELFKKLVKTADAVLESYATVHHLVSTVTGELHKGKNIIDLIKASWPGGSITGAPKIRSMEIIDELEPTARSVYTGGIGYLGFNGMHDINIAIRTMIITGGRVYFQVGGGIVADSDPESEFQETLDKGKAMFAAVTGQL